MTASRKQEQLNVNKIFFTDAILPETHEFETALEKRGDLHLITFQLLWRKLNELKKEEFEYKIAIPPNNYLTDAVKSAMQDATRVLAILNLFLLEKTIKTKEEIRDRIITLAHDFHKTYGDLAKNDKFLREIQGFYNAIKTNRTVESKEILLDKAKLAKAIASPSNVGFFWGNDYSGGEALFYQKLADTFYKLTRIDNAELNVATRVNQQLQLISQLRTELDTTLVTNPLSQLELILSEYKIALDEAVKKYNTIGQQTNVQLVKDSAKNVTKQIIHDYKKSINDLKSTIDKYPESFEKSIIKSIKDAKDRNAEIAKIKTLLLTRKKKLLAEHINLDKQLSNESTGQKESQKYVLLQNISKTEIPIRQEELPDSKAVQINITALQLKASDPQQMVKLTCESLLTYQTKLNQLAEDTLDFCNKLQVKRETELQELIEKLGKSLKELSNAGQYISQFNLSDAKLISPVNQSLDLAVTSIPLRLSSLHTDIEKNANGIIRQFELALNAVKFLYKSKKNERDRLVNDIARELKLDPVSQNEKVIKELPELLKKKTIESKLTVQTLHQNAEKQLVEKSKAALVNACSDVLKQFDTEIKNIQVEAKFSDLKKQLEEKNEDLFLAQILKNINEDEAATDLEKKRKMAEAAEQKLEEAKKTEERARAGESSQNIAAAERERLVAEQLHRVASLKATESEAALKTIQLSPITTPKINTETPSLSQRIRGFFAGLGSMIAAPVAWFYGSYQFAKEIKQKYNSLAAGIAAGFAAFVFMPLGWIFGGVRIGQSVSGEKNTESQETQPLLSLDSPPTQSKKVIEFSPLKLPVISVQEQFKTICTKRKIEFKSSESTVHIATQPRQLFINNKSILLIKDAKKDIECSSAATTLIRNILTVLDNHNDLSIDINRDGLVILDIHTDKIMNRFYLSAGNPSDSSLLYVNEKSDSDTRISLHPLQFGMDKLKTLLYQSISPAPEKKAMPLPKPANTRPLQPEATFNFQR